MAAATLTGGAFVYRNLPSFLGEKVIAVTDGDTFTIGNGQLIRLANLDAPELPYCMGRDAKAALTKLILGKRVFLKSPRPDPFRRITAYVYTGGKEVNEVMVRSGLAEFISSTDPKNDRIKQANGYARQNHIGIFSPVCFQPDPPDPECAIKANNNEYTKTHTYYTPDCHGYSQVIIEKYRGDQWFCTENDARKAGFTKSTECP